MKSAVRPLAIVATTVLSMLAFVAIIGAMVSQIPNGPLRMFVPSFQGTSAAAKRIASNTVPSNPFTAASGRSNIHGDPYQTDTYTTAGPLGRNMSVNSTFRAAECATVTFDRRGRIVTICVGLIRPELALLDPNSLDEIASYRLPPRVSSAGDLLGALTDFSGGGYFYLDNLDRAVVPTNTLHIKVIGVATSGQSESFRVLHDYDLTSVVPQGDKIVSVMPDSGGRIWFVSRNGVVGNVTPSTGAVRALATGEKIGNSFAVDENGGVFVVTDAALYRFGANSQTGAPQVTWRETYANTGVQKPGQTQIGSGTTPTIMQGGLIAITDNADPIDVVVVRGAPTVSGPRTVCTRPVFSAGASATDNTLIAAGNSLVVENNYGYSGILATSFGKSTTPGIAKVKVNAATNSCSISWVSNEIAPSAVPKLSLSTGLVYTYTKAPKFLADAWYFTAIDFCTGKTVYRRLAGTGFGFNNNYAPVTLASDGDAYIGVMRGLVRLRDASPPVGAPTGATPAC